MITFHKKSFKRLTRIWSVYPLTKIKPTLNQKKLQHKRKTYPHQPPHWQNKKKKLSNNYETVFETIVKERCCITEIINLQIMELIQAA